MDVKKLGGCLHKLGVKYDRPLFELATKAFDEDQSGLIEFDEFVEMFATLRASDELALGDFGAPSAELTAQELSDVLRRHITTGDVKDLLSSYRNGVGTVGWAAKLSPPLRLSHLPESKAAVWLDEYLKEQKRLRALSGTLASWLTSGPRAGATRWRRSPRSASLRCRTRRASR